MIQKVTLFTLLVFLIKPLHCQQVDAGNGHAIILTTDGSVWTCGRNNHGQLGVSYLKTAQIPIKVAIPGSVAIARGYDHSIAIDSSGHLWVWGSNENGQLGIKQPLNLSEPTQIYPDLLFSNAAGGYSHSIFLTTDGSVWSTGSNIDGESGTGNLLPSDHLCPVLKSDAHTQLTGIVSIETVGNHNLALDSSGHVYSWGANYYGELGHFNSTIQPFAEKIDGLPPIKMVAAGWGHSVALDSLGNLFVWGAIPSTYSDTAKVSFYQGIQKKQNLPPLEKIACGSWHSMAIDKDGQVWTWGRNIYGMLGTGNSLNQEDPMPVNGITNAREIGGGCFQSLVITDQNKIFSFGDNVSGQQGTGNHERNFVPKQMQFISLSQSYLERTRDEAVWNFPKKKFALIILVLLVASIWFYFKKVKQSA